MFGFFAPCPQQVGEPKTTTTRNPKEPRFQGSEGSNDSGQVLARLEGAQVEEIVAGDAIARFDRLDLGEVAHRGERLVVTGVRDGDLSGGAS